MEGPRTDTFSGVNWAPEFYRIDRICCSFGLIVEISYHLEGRETCNYLSIVHVVRCAQSSCSVSANRHGRVELNILLYIASHSKLKTFYDKNVTPLYLHQANNIE